MMNQADKIKETINLNKFLSATMIEKIIDMSIKNDAAVGYRGRLEVQTLLDALNQDKAGSFTNAFPYAGANAVIEGDNIDLMPKGTYEFLYEEDLGAPVGNCHNYHCNHPIRYAEHIRHMESGREFIVGNVCLINLLGEHDLLLIAVSLLSRISNRIDQRRKISEICDLVGDTLCDIHMADPLHKLTPNEGEFLKQLNKGSGSLLTLKRAQEIKDQWPTEKINELSENIRNLVKAAEDTASEDQKSKKKETLAWITFLKFKDYDNKRREILSDFIQNCLDDIEIHGSLAETRKSSLKSEKALYDRVRSADPTLIIDVPVEEDRYFLAHLMNHVKTCDSYFYISVVLSAMHFKSLTPGQKNALTTKSCKCGFKIPERR